MFQIPIKIHEKQIKLYEKKTINGTAAQEGLNFTIDALGAAGSTITAIPEPSAGLLGAIGCIVLLLRRRR